MLLCSQPDTVRRFPLRETEFHKILILFRHVRLLQFILFVCLCQQEFLLILVVYCSKIVMIINDFIGWKIYVIQFLRLYSGLYASDMGIIFFVESL